MSDQAAISPENVGKFRSWLNNQTGNRTPHSLAVAELFSRAMELLRGWAHVEDEIPRFFFRGYADTPVREIWAEMEEMGLPGTPTLPRLDSEYDVRCALLTATAFLRHHMAECVLPECFPLPQTSEQNAVVPSPSPANTTVKKPKRSTVRGEGRDKLIAAITKHHKYSDGSCLNLEPIGNNELARLANVSVSTASAFLNKAFGIRQRDDDGRTRYKDGHIRYRVVCRDAGRLVDKLKRLNGDFSEDNPYGRQPPGEVERDDEE